MSVGVVDGNYSDMKIATGLVPQNGDLEQMSPRVCANDFQSQFF